MDDGSSRTSVVPIQDVLHRIQWDPAWSGSRFDIGYVDRVAGAMVRVPLHELQLDGGASPALTVRDSSGTAARIPLHRIRRVWRDGTVIWERRPLDALQWPHDGDRPD